MLLVGIIALLVGIGLGSHCKVMVLLPLHGAGGLVAAGFLMAGTTGATVMWGAALGSLCANVGYALGGVLSGPGRERGPGPQWQRVRF